MVSSGESQHTLDALFIFFFYFGLGNWIVLIIYVSCCKQAGKGQEGGRRLKGAGGPTQMMASNQNILNLSQNSMGKCVSLFESQLLECFL